MSLKTEESQNFQQILVLDNISIQAQAKSWTQIRQSLIYTQCSSVQNVKLLNAF
jgi:hypothetical protein